MTTTTHTFLNSGTADLGDDVQDIIKKKMNDNIDNFLERQEHVSLLVHKTTKLNNTSQNFKQKAIIVNDRLWRQKMKNSLLLIFTMILYLTGLFMFTYIL